MDEQIQWSKFTGEHRRLVARAALGLALLLGVPVAGQSPFPQAPANNNGKFGTTFPDSSSPFDHESTLDQKRVRMLNDARQKSLVSDTEKLLKLARELNDEMAGADPASMTDAQMRKVAEIGKLARSIKEKMSYTAGALPSLTSPMPLAPVLQ